MDSESVLLARAQAGDQEAFGELVNIYHQRVYAVAFRFVRNPEEAKDLAQQAWIKAWRKLPTFRGEAGFFTWMYRLVAFAGLDHLRRRKRRAETELEDGREPRRVAGADHPEAGGVRPDRAAERDEIMDRFRDGLALLNPEQRMALTMREVDGLSYQEIARAMRCRQGTVMSRIFYARKRLQEHMRDLR